ncbi:MAG: pentapeptide repeat-containing protein [Pseudomonadota bacterium]|nr:pentapeptide repeat-containing protein [Pseudomonadota bacterium]
MDKLTDTGDYYEDTFKGLLWIEKRLSGASFEECEFIDCDFSDSQFHGCKFTQCEFVRCNLSLTDMANSQLYGLTFKDCKLVGVDWTKADWPQYYRDFELKFQRCLLNDASFYGLTLNELVMDECRVHDADFREGNFTDSQMTHCTFDRSLFMHTNLERVDFSDSTGCSIDVLANELKGARFSSFEAVHLLESLGIVLVD